MQVALTFEWKIENSSSGLGASLKTLRLRRELIKSKLETRPELHLWTPETDSF